jgi:hypothetical protein
VHVRCQVLLEFFFSVYDRVNLTITDKDRVSSWPTFDDVKRNARWDSRASLGELRGGPQQMIGSH